MFNMSLGSASNSFWDIAGRSHYLMLSGILCFPLLGFMVDHCHFLGKFFYTGDQQKDCYLLIS